tara:strand:- start:238 stop:933 length:696 start_codon:yes stop_codon:yes gene_type:complete
MIEWQDDKDVLGRMFVLTGNPLFNNLRNAIDNHDADFTDALSWGQLKSKRWVVAELEKINISLGTVYLCAGWYGTLAAMLFNSTLDIKKIRSFDIDESCMPIADAVNKPQMINEWKFKSITQDILDIDYQQHTWAVWSTKNNRMSKPITDTPNTIINTSCEHIFDFEEWFDKIPQGKLVVLQSNNFFEVPGHVNCVNDLDDFASQAPLSEILYEGTLELPKYDRFMRVGYK